MLFVKCIANRRYQERRRPQAAHLWTSNRSFSMGPIFLFNLWVNHLCSRKGYVTKTNSSASECGSRELERKLRVFGSKKKMRTPESTPRCQIFGGPPSKFYPKNPKNCSFYPKMKNVPSSAFFVLSPAQFLILWVRWSGVLKRSLKQWKENTTRADLGYCKLRVRDVCVLIRSLLVVSFCFQL